MKAFLLATLSLLTLFSYAQIMSGISTRNIPANDSHKTDYENAACNLSYLDSQRCSLIITKVKKISNLSSYNSNIDPTISVDSSDKKSSNYQIWYKLSVLEIGFSYSSPVKSDLSSDKSQYELALINFAMGFHKLSGLGFGTKVSVFFSMPDNIEIHSWAPLYAYFPLYISRKKSKPCTLLENGYNIPFMINLYAGGSLWCSTSSSYNIEEGAILAEKFYHMGVNCMFLNYANNNYRILNGNFSLDTGMIFYQIPGEALKPIFNIGLIYAFIGNARILYK